MMLMDLYGQYIDSFSSAVRRNLLSGKSWNTEKCRSQLLEMAISDKLVQLLTARACLRIAVGLTANASLIGDVFRPDGDSEILLYIVDDLLKRLPQALPKVFPPPMGNDMMNPVSTMKMIHCVLYRAELEQDYDLALALLPS